MNEELRYDEAEWVRLCELSTLEVECRVLAAEAEVAVAEVDDMELRLYVKENPDRPVARGLLRHEAGGRAAALAALGRDGRSIEGACYGWRRDYGEWPSLHNLSDRVAASCGIRRSEAMRRIRRAVNDPSNATALHVIRRSRLGEVLAGEPQRVATTWNPQGEDALAFYVTADAQADLAETYSLTEVSVA